MSYLIAAGLGLALAYAGKRLLDHRRAIAALHEALAQRTPFLREDLPGALGGRWDALCETSNVLVSELARLTQLRSGHLAQLEATLGSLQEGVLVVDQHNYIILANRALHSIFPRVRQILNQRLELVLQSSAFLAYLDAVRRGTAGPRHEIEFVEGTETHWVEVTGTRIPSFGGQNGSWTLFVLHDITRQRRLENVRRDFVANVSHELRTPLSVIKGYVETLVDGHHEMPLSDRDRFLKTVQRHTERLNSLLEDLLILSRLESVSPGLRQEPVQLGALVESILDDYRSRPAAAGHHLATTIDPTIGLITADPLKLGQVFENLLDNALKYTPRGSRIEITARPLPGEVELAVRDNGPGIPAADLPHIFERFYRVDKGRSRDKGGTGLGLSIVKHIVQLHGGRVWVESQLEQGATFSFTLPVRPAASSIFSGDEPSLPPSRDSN